MQNQAGWLGVRLVIQSQNVKIQAGLQKG
uniref:Uncharacterized protein n=1 Tax=Anguilla anguilla TaxID=7936 RepID=A0A0E9W6A1_ANGAN